MRWRSALLAAAQLYSSMYYAVFFTVYVAALFAALCWLTRPALRPMLAPAAIAGALALLLALPLARTYSSAQLGDREVPTVTYYSATAADYLRAHPRSATWGNRTLPGGMPERALFPGVMILLLAAVALIPPLGVTRAAYAVALLVAFEMSRGFNSVFYPYLYDWLPFIRGLRVPARASILVGLTLALLAASAFAVCCAGRSAWLQRADWPRSSWPSALICGRRCGSNPSGSSRLPSTASSPALETSSSPSFPSAGIRRRFTPNVPYMYFSLWHWAEMINGYSGHSPPGQVDFEVALQRFPGAGSHRSAAGAWSYACDHQLRALPRRMRRAGSRRRRAAGVSRCDGGQVAGCASAALRAQALKRPAVPLVLTSHLMNSANARSA